MPKTIPITYVCLIHINEIIRGKWEQYKGRFMVSSDCDICNTENQ